MVATSRTGTADLSKAPGCVQSLIFCVVFCGAL